MKKIFSIVAVALLFASAAFAFDWKVQSNEELRSDMLAYAEDFAKQAHGTKAGKIVSKLVKTQSKAADPYSWIADTYETVRKLEEEYGPIVATWDAAHPELETSEAMIRRRTLQLLDYPIHVPDYLKDIPDAQKEAFLAFKKDYLAKARAQAIGWLNAEAPEAGTIRILKVYNMGYILRTSNITALLDLRWDGSETEADFIADKADIFFLTHPHGDHYSDMMLSALQKADVPVVLPKDLMPGYSSKAKHIVWGNENPMTVKGVRFTSLRGNQGAEIPNNVYTIEIDGWRIVASGDNSDHELEKKIADQKPCDIVLASSWNSVQIILDAAMKPQGAAPLFIPGHENEFGHGVGNRESYHELFERKDRLANPDFKYPSFVLMDIGENIEIRKPSDSQGDVSKKGVTEGGQTSAFAVSKVKVRDSDTILYTKMTDYLAGKVPGLQVMSDGKLRIRGITSVEGSRTDPLILVDGVEILDINTISPADVANVEVLKDSSASIYGMRGGAGVILITLKR